MMKEYSVNELKNQIQDAVVKEGGFQAAVCYGELRRAGKLSDDENHFYYGLTLAANKQYESAISTFKQVSEKSDLYEQSLIWLGIEYSSSGNVDGLFSIFEKIGNGFPFVIIAKLIINVIITEKRKSIEVFNDLAERLTKIHDWDTDFEFHDIKFDTRDDRYFVIDKVITSIVDAVTEIYRYAYVRMADPNNYFNLGDSPKYIKSVNILRVFEIFLLPEEYKSAIYTSDLIRDYCTDDDGDRSICNVLFLNNEPPANILNNIEWKHAVRFFLDMFYDLYPDDLNETEKKVIEIDHMWSTFKIDNLCCPEVIRADEDFLIQESRNGNEQCKEVLGMYYAVKTLAGIPSNINKFLMQEDTFSRRITNGYKRALLSILLDSKAEVAYEIAQMQIKSAIENEFVWEDAGPISLSYFRILELEINRMIVKPLCKAENFTKIDNVYQKMLADAEAKSQGALKKLKNKWGITFNALRKMQDTTNSVNGMELGPLLHLFELLRSTDDEMTRVILSIMRPLLNENGNIALDTGLLSQMISEEKREKFRNPPAHTRYLPLSVALECREYVVDSLIQLNEWVKESEMRRYLFKSANHLYTEKEESSEGSSMMS